MKVIARLFTIITIFFTILACSLISGTPKPLHFTTIVAPGATDTTAPDAAATFGSTTTSSYTPTLTSTSAPVTITIWHGMAGTEADTLTSVINNFKAENPGIIVKVLVVPFDQLQNKFTTEASTGGGPDLFYGPKYWIGSLANSNLISPLDDISTQVGLDQLIQTTVDANKFKGKVFAFPESAVISAVQTINSANNR